MKVYETFETFLIDPLLCHFTNVFVKDFSQKANRNLDTFFILFEEEVKKNPIMIPGGNPGEIKSQNYQLIFVIRYSVLDWLCFWLEFGQDWPDFNGSILKLLFNVRDPQKYELTIFLELNIIFGSKVLEYSCVDKNDT